MVHVRVSEFSFDILTAGGLALPGSAFGSGDSLPLIESVDCDGTERSLYECSILSSISANDSEIAVIKCNGQCSHKLC